MPWASVRGQCAAAAETGACAGRGGGRARRRGAGAGRACRIRRRLSARIVRRHEDAGVAGARAGHRSGYSADGRAVRRARRDHPLPAQQRSAGAVAQSAQDRHLRHPFGVRVGLSVAARDRDDARGPGASAPSFASTRRSRGARIFAPRPNMPAIAARFRTRWRRPIQGRSADERLADHRHRRRAGACRTAAPLRLRPHPASRRRARGRHRGLGAGGADQRYPALCAAGAVGGVPDAGQRLAGAVAIAADHAADHAGRVSSPRPSAASRWRCCSISRNGWNIRCFPMP